MKKADLDVIKTIEARYGKGSIFQMDDDSIPDFPSVSTQSYLIDDALGIGGIPVGRITEVFGLESCVSYDTFLRYEIYKNGKKVNSKGGTISHLYERFYNMCGDKRARVKNGEDVKFYVKSVNHNNCIIKNEMLDVVKTGKQLCFRVKTECGNTIRCTKEHKFLTEDGYKPLEKLKVGDVVYVHNNTTNKKNSTTYKNRKDVFAKYHPYAPIKKIKCDKCNKEYVYYRIQLSRFIFEAHLNGMSFEEYKKFLNTRSKREINFLKFIPKNMHVHHLDENFNNNDLSNLILIDSSKHGKIHAKDRVDNLNFIATQSKIVKISKEKELETYDIKCAFPFNNYIANKFVIHNSGKTTLSLHCVAEAQKSGNVAFIDAEHALDRKYAKNLGVNIQKLYLSQPDCGEDALEICKMLVESKKFKLVVVDSVAALVPRAEVEGDMGDSHMGLQARLMSQAMRKLSAIVSKTSTSVIFINQVRHKIGIMFGNPEVTSGGNALKFYSSVRMDIRRIKTEKDKNGVPISNQCRVKIVKNKLAPPFREAIIHIKFGIGIDAREEIVELGLKKGTIVREGAYYTVPGLKNKVQGKEKLLRILSSDKICDHVKNKVLA